MAFSVRALGQVAVGNVRVDDDNVHLEVTFLGSCNKFTEVVQATIRRARAVLLDKK